MTDTKEQILMTALHLFAQDGYEAVSVSRIAGALGMTKGGAVLKLHCRRAGDSHPLTDGSRSVRVLAAAMEKSLRHSL